MAKVMMFKTFFRALALLQILFLLAAGVPAPVLAQSADPAPAAKVDPALAPKTGGLAAEDAKPSEKLAAWKTEIEQINIALKRTSLTERELDDLKVRAERLRAAPVPMVAEIQPRLAAAQARVKQLAPGSKGAEGAPAAPETDELKEERRIQAELSAELDGLIKQATVVQLQADEVIRFISDIRRDRFTRALFAKTKSIVDPSLWLEAAGALPRLFSSFGLLVRDWVGLLADRATESGWAVIALSLGIFAVLISPVRRRLMRATDRDTTVTAPDEMRKALAALAIVAANVSLPTLGLLAILTTLRVLELSPERIDRILVALLGATIVSIGIAALAVALLAPSKPQWRMVRLGTTGATRLVGLLFLLALLHGAGAFLVDLASILFAPVALTVVLTGVTAAVDTVLVMMVLRSVGISLHRLANPADPAPGDVAHERSALWGWLLTAAWLASFAALGAAAFGYIALARFIATEMIWAGAVFGVLFMLLILVEESVTALIRPGTALAETLVRAMGLSRPAVEQLAVVTSGLTRLMLTVLAFVVILAPTGISTRDIYDSARDAFFGFRLGGLTISPSSLMIGLALFGIGAIVTRRSQHWLEERFLPHTQMDAGLKNSIRTTYGYVGYVIAAMIGFSSAGIGLENIAIVAGALSLGIGFGLQSIVNNFVSGLILLVERPIKTGDMIEVGTERGYVRKINVRSTEIETFDRASLIVPNSTLISGNVKNWMHRDPTGRGIVDILVPFEADAEAVLKLMMDAATAHKQVLYVPEPSAMLTAFTEAAMRFRLVVFVGNVNDAGTVESELRVDVLARLRAKGIAMYEPRSHVRIDGLDDLKTAAAVIAAARPAEPKDMP